MTTKNIKMVLIAVLLIAGSSGAVWLNLPQPDPWAGVPPGQPHPRIGGRIRLDDRTFIHLPPLAVDPRQSQGPAHWREVLNATNDDALLTLLGPPDQQVAGPGATTSRVWHSWCPAADYSADQAAEQATDHSTKWVAHLWLESHDDRVTAVHVVAGGGVLLDETQSPPKRALIPLEVPLPR